MTFSQQMVSLSKDKATKPLGVLFSLQLQKWLIGELWEKIIKKPLNVLMLVIAHTWCWGEPSCPAGPVLFLPGPPGDCPWFWRRWRRRSWRPNGRGPGSSSSGRPVAVSGVGGRAPQEGKGGSSPEGRRTWKGTSNVRKKPFLLHLWTWTEVNKNSQSYNLALRKNSLVESEYEIRSAA